MLGTRLPAKEGDKRVPVPAPTAPSGPFRGVLLAGSTDVRHDDALFELKRFLEFDDGLFMCCLRRKRFAIILW